MSLAVEDDVRAALRRDLTEAEQDAVDAVLAEASDLVTGYLHPYQMPSPIPGPIVRVVAAMAAAVLSRPANILPDTQSLSADSYGVTFAAEATSPGPRLTTAFKERLRPYRSGLVNVIVGSERGFSVAEDDE